MKTNAITAVALAVVFALVAAAGGFVLGEQRQRARAREATARLIADFESAYRPPAPPTCPEAPEVVREVVTKTIRRVDTAYIQGPQFVVTAGVERVERDTAYVVRELPRLPAPPTPYVTPAAAVAAIPPPPPIPPAPLVDRLSFGLGVGIGVDHQARVRPVATVGVVFRLGRDRSRH